MINVIINFVFAGIILFALIGGLSKTPGILAIVSFGLGYIVQKLNTPKNQNYMNSEETIKVQQELINVLYSQVVDLSMMSKIELGDDVIAEIKRLNDLINE